MWISSLANLRTYSLRIDCKVLKQLSTHTRTHTHLLCCAQLLRHVRLCATPWTAALQAPLSMGIFQARILEWVALPSSRGSSQQRDRTQVCPIAGRFITSCYQGIYIYIYTYIHTYTYIYISTSTLYIPTFCIKRLDVFYRFPPPRSNFNPLCCRPLLVKNRRWFTLFS